MARARRNYNRTQYSDDDKASALATLAANGGNQSATARALGIPCSTLKAWAAERGTNHGVAELYREKTQDLDQRFEALVHTLLDVLPSKLQDASLYEVSGALKIAHEALRTLRGQSTQIIDVRTDAREKLSDLVARRAAASGTGLDTQLPH